MLDIALKISCWANGISVDWVGCVTGCIQCFDSTKALSALVVPNRRGLLPVAGPAAGNDAVGARGQRSLTSGSSMFSR